MQHSISAEDQFFKSSVEDCSIPVTDFNHRAHLRLAYVYLAQNNAKTANELMRNTLNRLLQHNDIEPSSKYHETLTNAWILAVDHFMSANGDYESANNFIDENPELLDSNIMLTHYSSEVLFSDEARRSYVEPDLEPIPRYST